VRVDDVTDKQVGMILGGVTCPVCLPGHNFALSAILAGAASGGKS
jgi:hypothetical protein